MSGEFQTTLTYENYLAANWLAIRHRWLWRGLVRFVAVVGTVYLVIGMSLEVSTYGFALERVLPIAATSYVVACGALLGMFVYWLWCIPRAAKKMYAQMRMDGVIAQYCYDESGMRCVTDRATMDLEWTHVVRWIENQRLLLIFQTDIMFFCVTKEQVDTATLSALKDAMSAASVPSR